MTTLIETFVGLLLAVVAVGWLARKLSVPYPILLVIGGLVLGIIPGLPRVQLNPDLVFLFLLPPLIYPTALFTSWRDFSANLRPICLLAFGLVLFTTIAIGLLAHAFFDLPLAAGFVLGAIISPPDAIAATAIAERLSVPRRIVTVLEGESLVNDATALVAYRFAIAAMVSGGFSMMRASSDFVLVVIGGIAIGLGTGWVVAWIHRHVDDPAIEVTISLLTPYLAYLSAERIGVSGVLAVVTAGLFIGWRSPEITSSRTRLHNGPVWETIQFILNGFVFILIGLELPEVVHALAGQSIARLFSYAIVITLAVILIRIVWVFPATYLPRWLSRKLRERDPYPAWQHVSIVAWTGMRGVLSLAAALAVPLTTRDRSPFPGRALILFLTFVVILATLVIQGLSLPFLIRWLGIKDDRSAENEEREARLKANQSALARLRKVRESAPEKEDALRRLEIEYEDRIRQLESSEPNCNDPHRLFSSEYEQLSREALIEERRTILRLRNERVINDAVLRHIQRDIDLAEERLRHPW